jgi:hypothetical protein
MFYWFKRGDALVRYEAREVSPTHFELRIIEPDGVERVERFDTAEALHRRQVAFEQELTGQGWIGPHGWNV